MTWLTLSAEAERAIRLINRVRVMVATSRACMTAMGRRGGEAAADINEAGITRAWSILEAYLHDRGEAVARRDVLITDPPPRLVGYLYSQTEAGFKGRFPALKEYWKDALGVTLSTAPRWSRVPFYHQLRNHVVHAVGQIPGKEDKLHASLQIELKRRRTSARLAPGTGTTRFPVYDSDVDELVDLVRGVILWADRRT